MTGPGPLPGRRKVIPKPFHRPVITVAEATRTWQNVPIGTLAVGDIVAGEGRIASITPNEDENLVFLRMGLDDIHVRLAPADLVVHAFTRMKRDD